MKKKVLIIGGSYAGVKAGKTLHKIFKNNDDVEITLVDKNPFHTLMTELHEVAGHRTDPDSIRIDLRKIFRERKVRIVTDKITKWDFENKTLEGARFSYEYDYLILAVGNESNFFGVNGAEENSHTLWSYEDAVNLREHVEDMFVRASFEHDIEERKRLLTFAVCGGGFTGVEMVGELGEAKDHLAKKYGVDKSEVTIYNIEALNRILNMLKEDKLVNKIENKYFKKLGVTLLKNSAITSVDKDNFTLADGKVIPSYTLIWTAGIMCVEDVHDYSFDKGRGARICVNEHMQALEGGKPFEGVYIAGDCAFYEDEKDGMMPQIVEAAEQSAHTAALNIGAEINGTDMHTHKQEYHGFMVSVGSRRGVADVGFTSSGWFAIFVKHFVNIYYQFLVAGVMQVTNYLRHEIFNVKNKRSFVGAHFSKRSPNFWQVPLRIFLGFMWLAEGVLKINEGWFTKPKVVNTVNFLAGYNKETGTYARDIVPEAVAPVAETVAQAAEAVAPATEAVAPVADAVAAASPEWIEGADPVVEVVAEVADTVSGASAEWADGGEAVIEVVEQAADAVAAASPEWVEGAENIVEAVPQATDAIVEGASQVIESAEAIVEAGWQFSSIFEWVANHKPGGYGDALIRAPKFVVWIMNRLVSPIEVPVQIMMVVMEILIGLCFMGGLFTFPMALISIIMTVAITFTGMADLTMAWYFFGGFAILMGAGRAFGLDYYVIPWLKRLWSGTKFAGKSYLYFDHFDDE
jgi:NADH:ubiquinone reductase (H+-translocating)